MCLGCNHHSEKRLRVVMIDDGQAGDGPWNCSTPSVPLIAGRSSEVTSLHLPRINKATIGFAELPSRSLRTTAFKQLKLRRVSIGFSDASSEITCVDLYFAFKICLCVCANRQELNRTPCWICFFDFTLCFSLLLLSL